MKFNFEIKRDDVLYFILTIVGFYFIIYWFGIQGDTLADLLTQISVIILNCNIPSLFQNLIFLFMYLNIIIFIPCLLFWLLYLTYRFFYKKEFTKEELEIIKKKEKIKKKYKILRYKEKLEKLEK